MGTLIGLTGQTGAGKTTVASLLAEDGFYIIDGDRIAREITEPRSPVLSSLSEVFGRDIIKPDGSLDRRKLANRAFSTAEGTAALCAVTHPAIIERTMKIAEQAFADNIEFVVFDAAALLESDIKNRCRHIISVVAPENVRLERILRRDGITREEAYRRINAQKSEQYYIDNADIVIRNAPPYVLGEEVSGAIKLLRGWQP